MSQFGSDTGIPLQYKWSVKWRFWCLLLHPGVAEHLVCCVPLIYVLDKEMGDEVLCFL
jgi:hypothetical protein